MPVKDFNIERVLNIHRHSTSKNVELSWGIQVQWIVHFANCSCEHLTEAQRLPNQSPKQERKDKHSGSGIHQKEFELSSFRLEL
mmetsp:Transcript_25900/g.62398  ORF Transcript_25900/g.62398 Transcript_25900/m.62398 type:complete len:84 (+) Transcript_25900:336-587(+)